MYGVDHLKRMHFKSMDNMEKERQEADRKRKLAQKKIDQALEKTLERINRKPVK